MSSTAKKSSCIALSSSGSPLLPPMLPRPPTRRWVTFDDLEGAAAVAVAAGLVASASTPALTTTTAPSAVLPCAETVLSSSSIGRVDFSKSLGSERDFESGGIPDGGRLQRSGQQRLSDSKIDGGNGDAESDRYSAFREVRGKKATAGWSGKIRHGSHLLGWSEELLEFGASGSSVCSYSSDDAEAEAASTSPCSSNSSSRRSSQRPSSLCVQEKEGEEEGRNGAAVEEDSWYSTFRNPSWDQSPDRRFVRNFP